jgi:putative membrane protein
MKTLVLNVDRDDDFGRKAKITSPIVGYKNNILAANRLGQVDPEDSDLNAIFYAITTYNQLKKEGKDVEIATICGHIKVGFKSDEILMHQLEEVIEQTKVDDVLLVTDGAEDEYILPIIESRIKITSLSRVSVKQSKELEDKYYRFMKILEDEKIQKQFVLPLALVLIVWSFFIMLGMPSAGFGAIVLTLGLFLLIRVFRWERKIILIWEEIKSSFLTGKLSIYTYIIGIVIIIAFGIYTYTNINLESTSLFLIITSIMYNIVWGIVIAGLLIVFGRAVDKYVNDKNVPLRYYMAPFSLLAFGFIIYASSDSLYKAFLPNEFTFGPFQTFSFVFFTVTGILILLIGAVVHRYKKETTHIHEEYEKNKQKIAEKN